jgi:hypothetical protein
VGLTGGLVLIVIAIGMILIGRPADGVAARFLRVWIVGQVYAMATMIVAVMGVTLVISDLPF